jgi:hypothetical protein
MLDQSIFVSDALWGSWEHLEPLKLEYMKFEGPVDGRVMFRVGVHLVWESSDGLDITA